MFGGKFGLEIYDWGSYFIFVVEVINEIIRERALRVRRKGRG